MAAFLSGFQSGASAYGQGLNIRQRREEAAALAEDRAYKRTLDSRAMAGQEAEQRLRMRVLEQELTSKTEALQKVKQQAVSQAAAADLSSNSLNVLASLPRDTPAEVRNAIIQETVSGFDPEAAQGFLTTIDKLNTIATGQDFQPRSWPDPNTGVIFTETKRGEYNAFAPSRSSAQSKADSVFEWEEGRNKYVLQNIDNIAKQGLTKPVYRLENGEKVELKVPVTRAEIIAKLNQDYERVAGPKPSGTSPQAPQAPEATGSLVPPLTPVKGRPGAFIYTPR